MAPQPPDQKRKRGRPPGASKSAQDASVHHSLPDDNDRDVEDEAPPRKRGRKSKQDESTPNTSLEKDSGAGQPQPGKRGRPSKSKEQHAPEATEPVGGRKRRAGREPKAAAREVTTAEKEKANGAPAPADEEAPSSEPRRSRRERRAGNPDAESGAARTDRSPGNTAVSPSDRRSGPAKRKETTTNPSSSTPGRGSKERRPRGSDVVPARRISGERQAQPEKVARPDKVNKPNDASQEAAVRARTRRQMSPREEVAVGKRRRGRSSLDTTKSSVEGPSRPTKEKHMATKKTEALVADQPGGTAEPKRRGRRKAVASQEEEHESTQQPAKRKRKAEKPHPSEPEAEEAGSESGDEQQLPFRYLQESVRAVPRSTISKWNSLDPPSVHAINAFLNDAQRPVLFRLQDTNRRREHASAALSHICRRLRTKLVKGLPFPPPTGGISARANAGNYEDEFDFERTVDAVQTLENTLNPLLHAVGLLEREIEREENALAIEYDTLHKLETNARAEAQEWKGRAKREHVLARGIKHKGDGEAQDPRAPVELVPSVDSEVVGGLFKGLRDEELIVLSKQIGSHMESMKSNLQQIGGVVPAITKSKAALQQVLSKHLDAEQYESILLG